MHLATRLKPRCSAETFHLYYKSRFLGCEDHTLPNGVQLVIPHSSSSLDKGDFAEYMDEVEADLAERGVYLDE